MTVYSRLFASPVLRLRRHCGENGIIVQIVAFINALQLNILIPITMPSCIKTKNNHSSSHISRCEPLSVPCLNFQLFSPQENDHLVLLALALDPIPSKLCSVFHFFPSFGYFLFTHKLTQIFPILKRENKGPPLPVKTTLYFPFPLQSNYLYTHPLHLNFLSFPSQPTAHENLFSKAFTYWIWQTVNYSVLSLSYLMVLL